jgi:hypothetical protein
MDKEQRAFEAIRLLKEWSTAIVVVQSGALAVIGGLIKDGSFNSAEVVWLIISVCSFIISIVFAANVIGALPLIVEELSDNINKYKSIYKIRNFIGIPLWFLAFLQHLFAVIGLISFGYFIYDHLRSYPLNNHV